MTIISITKLPARDTMVFTRTVADPTVSHRNLNGVIEALGGFFARTPKITFRAHCRWASLKPTHGLPDDPNGPCVTGRFENQGLLWRTPVKLVALVLTDFLVLPNGLVEVSTSCL